jgi:hypothetical protein
MALSNRLRAKSEKQNGLEQRKNKLRVFMKEQTVDDWMSRAAEKAPAKQEWRWQSQRHSDYPRQSMPARIIFFHTNPN